MRRNIIIGSAVVILVLVAWFIFSKLSNRSMTNEELLPSPSESTKINLPLNTLKPQNSVNPPNPATCSIAGELEFTSHDNAINRDNLFTYQGLDDVSRQINWNVAPKDNLRIGPNLAASLKLPDGQSQIFVSLPDQPIAKQYTLTATMTYGRIVDGASKLFTAKCSGQTKVKLNY